MKQWVENRKQKTREVAEKNKLLKKKKRKVEENKAKKKDMWNHLAKLNSKFKDIKKAKRA